MNTTQTKLRTLSGWGNYPKIIGKVYEPENEQEIIKFTKTNEKSLLARGGGTSYGSASLNGEGVTVDTNSLNKILSFDTKSGILHCQSGVTLHDIIKSFHSRGWFLNVTPGTKRATVGGCVACDAHGKNWKAGSFCNFVIGINLVLHDGSIVYCDDKENPDLFHATFGGMGITGIILDVLFKLKKVNSSYLDVETIRFNSLKELFDLQNETMDSHEYLFSWLDSHKKGNNMGRGVLQRANHSKKIELIYKTKKAIQVPYMPNFTINRYSVRAFNNTYYLAVGKTIKKNEMYITDFFYPLDGLANWNRLYGRNGFVEYQIVIPSALAYETIFELLSIITRSKLGSFIAAIKPLSKSLGLLSFPIDGVTFAIDFAYNQNLWHLLDKLDAIVIESGGRVYLAKDARLNAKNFKEMYSDSLDKLEAVREKYHTKNKFESMMFNRLCKA